VKTIRRDMVYRFFVVCHRDFVWTRVRAFHSIPCLCQIVFRGEEGFTSVLPRGFPYGLSGNQDSVGHFDWIVTVFQDDLQLTGSRLGVVGGRLYLWVFQLVSEKRPIYLFPTFVD
jgi:hypothetical protein